MRFWPLIVTAVFLFYSATGLPTGNEPCDPSIFSRLLDYVDDATAIKSEHLRYFKFPSDNVAFHRLAAANAGSKKVLYFHVENAVLKQLNDNVFGDKQVSAALSNLYKRLLFEAISADPILKAQLIPADQGGLYSDYKSVRLGFRVPDREHGEQVNLALNRVYEATSQKFARELERYPTLKNLYSGRSDLSGNASHWNLAGVGANPEQASLAARQARTSTRFFSGQSYPIIQIQAFGRVMEKVFSQDMVYVEDFRQNLMHSIRPTGKAQTIFDSEGILRVEAIGILRKAETDPSISGTEGYYRAIRERFELRFGIVLTDANIEMLQKYFNKVNRYTPSIYADETETMHLAPMEGATHGSVSFDLRGAGDGNLRGAMLAMKETAEAIDNSVEKLSASQVSEIALGKLRRNQDAISADFVATREIIPQTLQSIGALHVADRVSKSGDEVNWLPDHDLSESAMAKAFAEIQRRLPPGKGLRITVQPQTYKDSWVQLDPVSRFDWSAKMDDYEKKLREHLGQELPDLLRSGELDRLQLTMVLKPHHASSGELKIWFSDADGEISPRTQQRLGKSTAAFANHRRSRLEFPEFRVTQLTAVSATTPEATVPRLYVPRGSSFPINP